MREPTDGQGRCRFLVAALLGCLVGACSPPDPGQVRLRVIATPPPDDRVLSPLLDPRLTTLELRGRDDRERDVLLGRARFDRAELAAGEGSARSLELGPLPAGDRRDMRLLALGAAGQQVLGLAVTRDVEVRFGETREYVFDLRRPLFFFGSGRRLVPQTPFSDMDRALSPGRRIAEALRQESLFRVVDPNSGAPLLQSYHLTLDGTRQAGAAAATSDGLSVLVATEGGTLHIVETLRIKPSLSIKLAVPAAMHARAVAVSPRDDSAVILHHEDTPPALGSVGYITLLRDLPGLRGRVSRDGDPLTIEIRSEAAAPIGPPLSAAYAPDGLLDVVFGKSPLQGGEPNCTQLAGTGKSTLRRYDPKTGQVRHQAALQYTTAVAWSEGEQLLVQPCAQARGGKRPGQVLFQRWSGEGFAPGRTLAAPGAADIAVMAAERAIVTVGRDDVADDADGTVQARGVVRVLEPGLQDWSLQSPFALDDWLLPYRVTVTDSGMPLPASVEIVLAPRDLLVYGLVATPDRSRALLTARVTHQVEGMFLNRYSVNNRDYVCYVDWLGYTYHVMLVNLQTGAREQDWMVGVQNQSCDSALYDTVDKRVIGRCFAECQDDSGKNGRLRGYQEGFIPRGTSALFTGR